MHDTIKTLHLVMHGRVQGVWFRDSMRREADRLEVHGWCRNRLDGTVEAMVQGAAADVDALVAWAHHGPELAQVSAVDVEAADGEFTGFEVRGDA